MREVIFAAFLGTVLLSIFLTACSSNETGGNNQTVTSKPTEKREITRPVPINNTDSMDLAFFMEMSGFNIYKFKLPDPYMSDSLVIRMREFYKGRLIDSYLVGEAISFYPSHGIMRCYTRHTDPAHEEFQVPNILAPTKLIMRMALKSDYSKYNWSKLYDREQPLAAKSGVEIPFLAYSTRPTSEDMPGVGVYCQLDEDPSTYPNWHRQFHIEHYWIFSLTFYERDNPMAEKKEVSEQ